MKSDKPGNRPIWAQQEGETAESFAAFVVYRDLGPARSLAKAQRLKGKPQKDPKRATGKRGASGCMKRWSRRWNWGDRATAWDAMLEATRTTAVVAAVRKDGQKWAARYEVFREDTWEQLQGVVVTIKQLIARPVVRVQTVKRAMADPKTEADARDVTSLVNPALDLERMGNFQTQLAQLSFGPLTRAEIGQDGSTENLTDEVVEKKSDKPDNRPPWTQQDGETAESFAAFVVYRDLGAARSLAEVQRLNEKPQKGRKMAAGKRRVSGCMNRWSKRWSWPDRALAWDAMLDGERLRRNTALRERFLKLSPVFPAIAPASQ
jgi:hypothetical protein